MKSIISLNFMTKPTIFHCQKAGLLTTVQDGGRIGFQAFGVPVAGVMDS
ncbi:MAG: antagonist of KipI, partial [Paraglaciecola sp.]